MQTQPKYQLFEYAKDYFRSMLDDIRHARHYIYLQVYKYGNGENGKIFRDELVRKCRQGVEVRVLIDSWGAYVNDSFFSELIQAGGKVRYFKKIKFFIDFFTKNHRRNHRKILVIDDQIVHLGSANIVEYASSWREAIFRIQGDIAMPFKKIFLSDFEIYNKYVFEKPSYARTIRHGSFEILRDVPSITMQRIRKRYLELIRNAQQEIIIETPYFLPGTQLRKSMVEAVRRGVTVKVLLPKHSDLRIIDILRNRYLGMLSKHKVQFLFFVPDNLHAKILLADRRTFILGSPNFDFRSFRYQHEIAILGRDPEATDLIVSHVLETERDCELFNYEHWLNRPFVDKFFERLLIPFRHWF
ncbi:MAG: phosphatidylserine/phosphatidylglycerophosphate/cardiolipin synthase family protein [Bacteroidales bacterium]|nr:phosphatidylserine/phosphatidylglycerophosphate/cardiolipin synthase family protein [Lentimicrobiaceae bacterium]MDD5696319.1 phosphatidylserine/phosphatidylglycerophosphate/cardiolipin synthase family protein [Bacteroidales bacterium]